MTALHDWAIRIVSLAFFFVVLVMRASVRNPIQALWLAGTRLDRWVTGLRFVLDWSLFMTMSGHFVDTEVFARCASGAEHRWWIIRDRTIGSFEIRSVVYRAYMQFAPTSFSLLAQALRTSLVAHFDRVGDPLVEVVVTRCVLASDAPDRLENPRGHPVESSVVLHERFEHAAGAALTGEAAPRDA